MLGLPIDAIMSQFAPLTGTGKFDWLSLMSKRNSSRNGATSARGEEKAAKGEDARSVAIAPGATGGIGRQVDDGATVQVARVGKVTRR